MTTGGGAVGSPRAVTAAGAEYVSHDGLELSPIPDSAIDYFADGDLSEYTAGGSGSATVQSSTTFSGDNALEITADCGIVSTSGLDNYPKQGDRWRAWIYPINSGDKQQFMIACDGNFNSGSPYVPVGYAFALRVANNEINIVRWDSSGISGVASTSATLSTGQWYGIEGIYKTDNTLEMTLVDSDLNTIAGPITGTDSTYAGNTGVAWSAGVDMFGDAAKLLN
jgi:hypothetical protein